MNTIIVIVNSIVLGALGGFVAHVLVSLILGTPTIFAGLIRRLRMRRGEG